MTDIFDLKSSDLILNVEVKLEKKFKYLFEDLSTYIPFVCQFCEILKDLNKASLDTVSREHIKLFNLRKLTCSKIMGIHLLNNGTIFGIDCNINDILI